MINQIIVLLEKTLLHIKCTIILMLYKIRYGSRFKYGKKVIFREGFKVRIENNGILLLGDDIFFNANCSINCLEKIVIGSSNRFGENVHLYDHNHRVNQNDWKEYTKSPITIGKHNWICTNTVVLKGVKIGDNTVIQANSLVSKNIPTNSLYINGQIIAKRQKS